MSLFGKLEVEVEIKAPAHMFHEVNTTGTPELPNICPQFIQKVDLLEGEWGEEGSIVCCYFLVDGKIVVSKEVLEVVDNVNLSITFKLIGGPLLELYKNVKFIVESKPKSEGGLVRNNFEYEKLRWMF
ncbi:MLP-like protein 43 [Morella rubra]|uniref:MLP-like protein 43 n=1 Tax=Morella rubra TaxID=262757 RepID=A0A6A1VTG2_9ROSI|nr:MLP-like protein 43 [Morella rubra]